MSELLPICIILIVLAAILYLAYSAATVYLSQVHNTRPHNAAVCICCLLAVLSICLNGAYGVDATGLLFLSILTGLLTVMTLTDIAVCRLPRIFTLSLIILGAAFRYSQDSLAHALLNASLWFGMIYLLRRIFLAVKGTEALGLGDVFLIAGIAMWTQPQHSTDNHRRSLRSISVYPHFLPSQTPAGTAICSVSLRVPVCVDPLP